MLCDEIDNGVLNVLDKNKEKMFITEMKTNNGITFPHLKIVYDYLENSDNVLKQNKIIEPFNSGLVLE